MAPVKRESREEQLANHMASFVYRETLEDQIKATDCSICMEPMGTNSSDAPARPERARSTPFYVDYCGNGHYFHKWCARNLLLNTETTSCPDCRAEPADVGRTSIAESYPMPDGGAPATLFGQLAAAQEPEPGMGMSDNNADDLVSDDERTEHAYLSRSQRAVDILAREDGTYPGIPVPGSNVWNDQIRAAWNRWARLQNPDDPTPQPTRPSELAEDTPRGRLQRSVVAHAVRELLGTTSDILESAPGSQQETDGVTGLAAHLEPLLQTRLHADTAVLLREYGSSYNRGVRRMRSGREMTMVRRMVENVAACFLRISSDTLETAIVRFMSALMISDGLNDSEAHLLGHTSDRTLTAFERFWNHLRAFERDRNVPVPTEFGDLTQHATDLLLVHIPDPAAQQQQQQQETVMVGWRFWVKSHGAMSHELMFMRDNMRRHFEAAMMHAAPELDGVVPAFFDWNDALGTTIHGEYMPTLPDRPSLIASVYRCEFILALPANAAEAFSRMVWSRLANGDNWETLVRSWLGYGPIHWQVGRDEPRIQNPERLVAQPEPLLSPEEFDAWGQWRHILEPPGFRAIGSPTTR